MMGSSMNMKDKRTENMSSLHDAIRSLVCFVWRLRVTLISLSHRLTHLGLLWPRFFSPNESLCVASFVQEDVTKQWLVKKQRSQRIGEQSTDYH